MHSFRQAKQESFIGIYLYDALAVAEKIGDYPIITAKEAMERLISGQYQTTRSRRISG